MTVGKAILESGGDAVFVDIAPSPSADAWSMLSRTRDSIISKRFSENIQEVAVANDVKAWYHQLNVTDADSVPPVFETIREEIRFPLRGLLACAGISGECDACDYPIHVFRKILDVNITGTFLITQAVAQEMHQARVTGSIVLIASMSGWITNRVSHAKFAHNLSLRARLQGINTSAYNASKSALHQLARSLAAEWGHPQNTFPGRTLGDANPNPEAERKAYPPIRVNTLSPGHIETPISEAARVRGLTDEWAKQNMLGRISQAEEYRAPSLFLLADGSSYMTGAVCSSS